LRQAIVVEGRHDAMRIRHIIPETPLVITGGAHIHDTVWQELEKLYPTHRIILMLDPDYAGNRIRARIEERLGPCEHIYLNPDECRSKDGSKVGVEHASDTVLMTALKAIKPHQVSRETLDKTWYKEYFVMGIEARQNRKKLANILSLPMGNGKTFYHTLNKHNITQKEIEEVWLYGATQS